MPQSRFLIASLLALSFLAVPIAQAQQELPQTIAYQGYLTNTDGDPTNGAVLVVFRLYDDDADGAQVWQETQPDVVFTDGVFSVRLGSVQPLEDVAFHRPLWLSVAVAGGAELQPRVPLEAVPYAHSLRHLRVVPGISQIARSPNLIGGHIANTISDDFDGTTIGGGGSAEEPNVVTGEFGTVGGGLDNRAGSIGTVGGGSGNVAGARATVAGGSGNEASGERSTIGGGIGNEANAERATVGGGANNTAGERGTIGGGENNTADRYATVGGGEANEALGEQAVIGGGLNNEASGQRATVAGGGQNNAIGERSTVGGGDGNTAKSFATVVSGGEGNVAEATYATVGGGGFNAAQGVSATVPGGEGNWANGDRSFAAGYQARTEHNGTFVWADYSSFSDPPFVSTSTQQFLIRARGGVGIGTNAPRGALHLTQKDLGLDPGDITKDAVVIEGVAPVITLYGNFQQNTRPGLVFAGVENGNVGDKWGIVREYFGFNALHFTYGTNLNHAENATAMSIQPDGPRAEAFHATEDLGASGTPNRGGHYRDNVVYAWAEVGAAGQFVDGFGCTVERIDTGLYRLTLKRSLPNGASVIVTPRGLGSPLLASAVSNGSTVDVALRRFAGGTFDSSNNAFYVQVVGRP